MGVTPCFDAAMHGCWFPACAILLCHCNLYWATWRLCSRKRQARPLVLGAKCRCPIGMHIDMAMGMHMSLMPLTTVRAPIDSTTASYTLSTPFSQGCYSLCSVSKYTHAVGTLQLWGTVTLMSMLGSCHALGMTTGAAQQGQHCCCTQHKCASDCTPVLKHSCLCARSSCSNPTCDGQCRLYTWSCLGLLYTHIGSEHGLLRAAAY